MVSTNLHTICRQSKRIQKLLPKRAFYISIEAEINTSLLSVCIARISQITTYDRSQLGLRMT